MGDIYAKFNIRLYYACKERYPLIKGMTPYSLKRIYIDCETHMYWKIMLLQELAW